ncbi:MAG: hypothetical protein V1659_01135 [Candidatus Woesearchaeota archaeon]
MCPDIQWQQYEFPLKNKKGRVTVVREILYEDAGEFGDDEEFM